MNKPVRFALIGCGWRSRFFARIAKALPEKFQLCGVFGRNYSKTLNYAEEWGSKAYESMESLILDKPDFVVVSVPRAPMLEYNILLLEKGIPVLSETPPCPDTDSLIKLYNTALKTGTKFQVAEQYFFQPYFQSILEIIREGIIGEVTNCEIAFCHGYHSTNVMRRILQMQPGKTKLWRKTYEFPVLETAGRNKDILNGEIKNSKHEYIFFEFENGRVGLHNFSSVQYHSWIRGRGINIQGTKGEIIDNTVRFMAEEGVPAKIELTRFEVGGVGDNDGKFLRCVMLGDKLVYQNPYAPHSFSDDEIAVAHTMDSMKLYLEGGNEFYSLDEAMEDTYLSFCMNNAEPKLSSFETQKMPWHK